MPVAVVPAEKYRESNVVVLALVGVPVPSDRLFQKRLDPHVPLGATPAPNVVPLPSQ